MPLDRDSVPKTAFITTFGKFEYVRLPFRLVNAPAYFQWLMDETDVLHIWNTLLRCCRWSCRHVWSISPSATLGMAGWTTWATRWDGHEGQGNSGVSTAPDKEEYAVLPCTDGLLPCSHPSIQYQSYTVDRPRTEETTRQNQVDTRTQQDARQSITESFVLATPDLEQPYHLYTDAMQWCWIGSSAETGARRRDENPWLLLLQALGRGTTLQCYRVRDLCHC